LAEKFIPHAEILKTHEIIIDAPAHIVFEVAELFDMQHIPAIRFLFRLREILLRIQRKPRGSYETLVSETRRLGWIKLESRPGRELAMGAVAQPGVGNIEFLQLAPEEFAAFTEPGFVKVVWTLEAEPIEAHTTLFRTQTRVVATDARSRSKFLLYWIFAGKLVSLIRILSLRAIRKEAERRLI
jgi:hypothetical protein